MGQPTVCRSIGWPVAARLGRTRWRRRATRSQDADKRPVRQEHLTDHLPASRPIGSASRPAARATSKNREARVERCSSWRCASTVQAWICCHLFVLTLRLPFITVLAVGEAVSGGPLSGNGPPALASGHGDPLVISVAPNVALGQWALRHHSPGTSGTSGTSVTDTNHNSWVLVDQESGKCRWFVFQLTSTVSKC